VLTPKAIVFDATYEETLYFTVVTNIANVIAASYLQRNAALIDRECFHVAFIRFPLFQTG